MYPVSPPNQYFSNTDNLTQLLEPDIYNTEFDYPTYNSKTLSLFDSSFPASDFPSLFDPAQFVSAVSAQLPIVQETNSPADFVRQTNNPMALSPLTHATSSVRQGIEENNNQGDGKDGRIVKVTWWRPHGQTAIAPGTPSSPLIPLFCWGLRPILTSTGLKRITLKVRVDPFDRLQRGTSHTLTAVPGQLPQEVINAEAMPNQVIMQHLLSVCMAHFGCQFPFLDQATLEEQIVLGTGPVFLLNAIASVSAR